MWKEILYFLLDIEKIGVKVFKVLLSFELSKEYAEIKDRLFCLKMGKLIGEKTFHFLDKVAKEIFKK